MRKLDDQEIKAVLDRSHLGVLSLARGSAAYALPILYAYHGGRIYFHGHPGRKEGFIEATEEVCLTILEGRTVDDWRCVLVFGRARAAHTHDAIDQAREALTGLPPPPLMGEDEDGEPARSGEDVTFWVLEPTRMTGRESRRAAHALDVL